MLELQNFSPDDSIFITAPTIPKATEIFARQTRSVVQRTLKEKLLAHKKTNDVQKSKNFLASALKLIQKKVFKIGEVDYLSRYLKTLEAYCEGAAITLQEGVFLQSFADLACQTIVVKDKATRAINIVHIEENPDDEKLFVLAKKLEEFRNKETYEGTFSRHADLIKRLYHYRVVMMKTDDSHQMFFAYPGLCSAGPAFGVNFANKTLFAADTLSPKPSQEPYQIWSNAIASMMFDCGNISTIKKLMVKLKKSKINVMGGYAMHIVTWGAKSDTISYEFSANKVSEQKAIQHKARGIVAQANYPLTASLRSVDLYEKPSTDPDDIQLSRVIKRRTNQLCMIAKKEIHPTANASEDTKKLLKTIASPVGDVETFDHGPVFAGFPTAYTAAHLVASFSTNGGKIIVGKLSAPPIVGNEYALIFNSNNPNHRKNMLMNVKDANLRVSIIYSTPTKRAIASGFEAGDEDTAYVAMNVGEALRSKNITVSLVPISESTIDVIDTLQTDCVFNLVEWTGLDMPLSQNVFAKLRKLDIPVTGATEQNFCETSDKIIAKKLLQKHHIPTPHAQAFYTGNERISRDLEFPAIVKPALEHGSIGLTQKAIASNETELISVVKKQIQTHQQPVLAESFIFGREILVYLLEQNGKVRVLPMEEIIFTGKHAPAFQTYESKWDKNHADYAKTTVTLARLTDAEQKIVERVSLQTFKKLGFRGYARLDIRFRDGTPYILEANANPNIYDSDEDQIPGIPFPDYVWEIVKNSLREYKNGWKI